DRPPERILLGFGAHLDPYLAMLRAVTELNQMLTWVGSMDNDPPEPLADWETRTWLETASLEQHPYLVPDSSLVPRAANNFARRWHADIRDDLAYCQTLLEQQGVDLLVLDQTRADVGLSVVKVFAPGMRHFWARYAPGRLYDVPVKLGWLQQP